MNKNRYSILALNQLKNISRKLSKPKKLVVYALYGKNAKIQAWSKEFFPLAINILEVPENRVKLEKALSFVESGYKRLDEALEIFYGSTKMKIAQLKQNVEFVYWNRLDLPFKILLENIDNESSLDEWETLVQKEGREAYKEGVLPLIGKDGRMIEAYVLGEKELTIKKGERR
jgi:hypothetical protein